MVLLVSSILTMLALSLTLASSYFQSEDLAFVGLVLLMLTLVFGWGIVGCLETVNTEYEKINNVRYMRTPTRLIVETDKDHEDFENIAPYNTENEKLDTFYKVEYNSYGWEVKRNIVLKIEGKDKYYKR